MARGTCRRPGPFNRLDGVHPKAIKQSHALAQLLKLPAKLAEHFFRFLFLTSFAFLCSSAHFDACVWALSGHYDLLHFLLRLLRLLSALSPPLSCPSALLAIFHMQHATDVFMFCVCAAHKKINEPKASSSSSSLAGKSRQKGYSQRE